MTEIARLRELLAEATPGPWSACGANGGRCVCGIVWADEESTINYVEDIPQRENPANAALIAAAVNALPSLLDRLEAAEAVVEAARRRCDDAVPGWAPELRAALRRLDEVSRGR